MLGGELIDDARVTDVALDEPEAPLPLHVLEVVEVAGVSQLVQHGDAVTRVFPQEKAHEVASDKASAAGDKKPSHQTESPARRLSWLRRRRTRQRVRIARTPSVHARFLPRSEEHTSEL